MIEILWALAGLLIRWSKTAGNVLKRLRATR
jgi:hypothetical protein